MADSFRDKYNAFGVGGYYENFGGDYNNPREYEVKKALSKCLSVWKQNFNLTFTTVLDLACGSGEATLIIENWAQGNHMQVTVNATDPYAYGAFEKRVGRKAERLSFEDIEQGALEGRGIDLIVSSFALHLVPPERLFPLCTQMALYSKYLIVVSPHKRPHIKDTMGWKLLDEHVVERVKSRLYCSLLN